jgi:hypothetical protein
MALAVPPVSSTKVVPASQLGVGYGYDFEQ